MALFTIGDDVRALYAEGIDTLINQLGRPCQLVLDGDRGPCPNCLWDGSLERSAGVYNGTGPQSFTRPPCPVCGGSGYDPATRERIEVKTFLVRRNLKNSALYMPGMLQRPVTLASIKGFATDIPLVMQAKYIVLDYLNAHYTMERYRKVSEEIQVGNIAPGRYFTVYLQKEE